MNAFGCRIENLSVAWGGELCVDNVNLSLNFDMQNDSNTRPMKIPLMGRSGYGKTSLLYTMAWLKRPTKGRVIWNFPSSEKTEFVWDRFGLFKNDEIQVPEKTIAELRRKYFGFSFQNHTLLPHLTIEENLIYPLILIGMKKSDAMQKARVRLKEVLFPVDSTFLSLDDNSGDILLDENIRKVEEKIDIYLRSFISEFSGGQLQRIALAQAMIHDPTVLFADEPTGNLDFLTREQVMSVLETWIEKGNGKNVLIWVTHHSQDPELMKVDFVWHVRKGYECVQISFKEWEKLISKRSLELPISLGR